MQGLFPPVLLGVKHFSAECEEFGAQCPRYSSSLNFRVQALLKSRGVKSQTRSEGPAPTAHGSLTENCGRDSRSLVRVSTVSGLFIIRIGFWGILYHNYNKEPPKVV